LQYLTTRNTTIKDDTMTLYNLIRSTHVHTHMDYILTSTRIQKYQI